MTTTRITDYLGSGLAAARPASLSLASTALGIYYATDTGDVSVWVGSAWSTANFLPTTPAGDVIANVGTAAAKPTGVTVSALLDKGIASAQGSIAFRNGTAWVALAPGASGQLLATQGAAADVHWVNPSAGSVYQVVAGIGLNGGTITATGTIDVNFGTAVATVAQGNDSRILGAEQTANKGVSNGYAGLDSSGKVPNAQLPATIVGGLRYAGTWNASTNSPTITSGAGTMGAYYVVSTAGSTSIDGLNVWNVGDWITFDGTRWDKLDGQANPVSSVAGRQGAVTLAVADVTGAAPLDSPTFTTKITLPSWASAPSTAAGVIGYNSGTGRYEFGIGASVINHVRLSGDVMTGALSLATGSTATTASTTDNSTLLATTAFVHAVASASGGGTVTQINAGTGLTGGPITSSGTLSTTGVGDAYIVAGFAAGTIGSSQVILGHRFAANVSFPANFGATGQGPQSEGGSFSNATGSTVFNIDQCPSASDPTTGGSWTTIGTMTFSASGHVVSFATTSGTTKACAIGDYMRVIGPSVADATLTNVCTSLAANRT